MDPSLALPATELAPLTLIINEQIDYTVIVQERHIKTSVVLEFYERNGQYKCRALAEHSTQSLSAFGQHLGISVNEKFPTSSGASGEIGESRPRPIAGETWTGTAFAIDSHLLTCHHVIDGASVIGIRQQGRADRQAFVVMSDEGSDTAILKVDEPLSSILPLGIGQLELLGENVVTMGFPLSGVSSQLQVTAGNIAGLLGIHDDIRLSNSPPPFSRVQVVAPDVVKWTSHRYGNIKSNHAQNMNYAVKYQLLSAILTSSGLVQRAFLMKL